MSEEKIRISKGKLFGPPKETDTTDSANNDLTEEWKFQVEAFEPKDETKGWICPKCGKANAPWKSSCDCSNQYNPFPYWKYDPPYTITLLSNVGL